MSHFCRRCGKRWLSFPGTQPTICPFCKDTFWNHGILSKKARCYLAQMIIKKKKDYGWTTPSTKRLYHEPDWDAIMKEEQS